VKKLLLPIIILLLALSGCGGNNGNNEAETTAATTIAPTTEAQPTTTEPTTTLPTTEPTATPSTVETETPVPLTATISILNMNDPHLPAFEAAPIEIDFVAMRIAEGIPAEYFEWVDPSWGIVIWADEPLYNLQVITIDHN